MKRITEFSACLFVMIAAGALAVPMAMAQNAAPPSLLEQLGAQYKVTKTGFKSGQVTITEAGTVLVIQLAGILGVPPISMTLAPATYKDGSLHAPAGLAVSMAHSGRNFRAISNGARGPGRSPHAILLGCPASIIFRWARKAGIGGRRSRGSGRMAARPMITCRMSPMWR